MKKDDWEVTRLDWKMETKNGRETPSPSFKLQIMEGKPSVIGGEWSHTDWQWRIISNSNCFFLFFPTAFKVIDNFYSKISNQIVFKFCSNFGVD